MDKKYKQREIERIKPRRKIKTLEKYFQNLLEEPPKIKEETVAPIVTSELNIKKGPFTMEELQTAAKGLDDIPAEVWKLGEFNEIILESCNSEYH